MHNIPLLTLNSQSKKTLYKEYLSTNQVLLFIIINIKKTRQFFYDTSSL